MTPARTFPELLARRLRRTPANPWSRRTTTSTGERTELSVTTYANWVSKTANLLTDELGLDAGDTVLLDLPPHWLVPGVPRRGLELGARRDRRPAAWRTTSRSAARTVGEHAGAEQVVACSLLPFAVRFPEPLPGGVLDYGLLWPGQSDVFVA